MLFTYWIPNSEFQYLLGWFFVGLVGILLGVNCKKVVVSAVKESWWGMRKSISKYQRKRLQLTTLDKKPSVFAIHQALKDENTTLQATTITLKSENKDKPKNRNHELKNQYKLTKK